MSSASVTSHSRYDNITIAFHWLTAALVIVLFGTSLAWNYFVRGPSGEMLQHTHVSLGIGLAAVLILRLVWRAFASRRLPGEGPAALQVLSRLVHGLLYLLLALQVGLGFGLRWIQGEEFSFFGLFSIPQLIGENGQAERLVENLHNISAWGIIYLVAAHAGAALVHRYVFRDGVLRRMLPIAG